MTSLKGLGLGLALLAGVATASEGRAQVVVGSASTLLSPLPHHADVVAAARDAADRMTVPVMVNGQGPFAFVVDTGADRTVISQDLATRLGLPTGAAVAVNGTGGVDVTPTAMITQLDVGGRHIRDVAAPILSGGNLGAQGMLGIDSLKDQRIVMDFERRRMTVRPSKKEWFAVGTIVVKAHRRLGQLVLVDASIGGRPIFVILDSGAQNTIGNSALAELLGVPNWRGRMLQTIDVLSVSGRTTPGQFADIPQVMLGGVKVAHMPIAFADLHTFAEFDLNDQPAMLLGMDMLRHFERVSVDFGRKEVSFKIPSDG